jgi:hypothetical protein
VTLRLRWREFRVNGALAGAMVIGPLGAGLFYDDVLKMFARGWLSLETMVELDRDRLIGVFED